ncbi:hypothetical protein PVL29_024576 [Vitis rotundifolia]|uniref:Uncharacterized protein n=1 Tax=Vitis rotundifolia TaxID=103349 RepID=A0AA39D8F6_VITRO|nr:hypothetical protein PVL29_024576 [Vitis rotundifolia]
MNKLRLLKVFNVWPCGSFEYFSWKELCADSDACTRMNKLNQFKDCKLLLSGDFKYLSNNLRCLYWHGYPLKSVPLNFHPEQLVELNMSYSRVEQLWKGFKMYQQLKFVKLSYSQRLIETPDFSRAPNRRRLILEGCTSLSKVHPSIGDLNNLVFLNLEGCKNLKSFLRSICMESLEILTLSGCSKLKKFPEVQGCMKHLSELSLGGHCNKRIALVD